MMKIAIVSHDSFWPLRGGGGLRVYWVVKKLSELGHEVIVLAPFISREGIQKEFPRIRFINLGNISRFQKNKERKYLALGYRVLKKLIRLKPEVIYAHNVVSAFPSLIVSRLKKIPLVYDIDDFTMGLSTGKLVRRYGPLLECFTARHSDKVVSMSDSLREELRKKGVKGISCISHGVDLGLFIPKEREKEERVIYMGGIEKHDGVPLIPVAAERVVKEFPGIKFVVIGVGSDLACVRKLVKDKGLESSFIFKGWVEHNKIPDLLSKARIGLVTHYRSLATDIALVLKGFEYMAMELPVIAPDLRGMKEEVGKNERGLIFRCGDSDDLAEKIIFLLKKRKLGEELGRRGREFVLKNCDWEKNALKIARICEETYEKNRAA